MHRAMGERCGQCLVIARRIADRMDSAVIRIAEVELEDNGARPQMRPCNKTLVHELRSTRAADCELHRATYLPQFITEGLADGFQRDAAKNAADRERADPIRVVGLRMTCNLCRKMSRDNGRGRPSLDQPHEEFRGELQPLIRVPQSHPVLKARARRARA